MQGWHLAEVWMRQTWLPASTRASDASRSESRAAYGKEASVMFIASRSALASRSCLLRLPLTLFSIQLCVGLLGPDYQLHHGGPPM